MKLLEIVDKLELEIVAGFNTDDKCAEGVYIGDLLSVVMSKAKQNHIWITIQTHINIIAVATLVDLAGIIVVEDMEIDKDTIDKANEVGIPLIKSSLSAYQLACKLREIGL
ncbi:DRTGG domain-containing protein [Proteiniborus ethanoligenes]|uniref:DRTGG domain-containing protein n=1 Tax=Proteiniborus ethanoligenes TaxID=415015 RepID=A0A1H3S2D8_9FIRM|nr:DRTGG domain-containing protein [Proteiniborus ethanoligenes]SDZ32156.1 DRTGG domain-containing protein [Proteiniborus ethanoligenes]